jgi:hypothetical protein
MLTLVTNYGISGLTLDIGINQNHDFTPKSESIKKYVDLEVNRVLEESRNSEKDLEFISFKPSTSFYLQSHFENSPSYEPVGFTNFYLTGTNVYTQESYYIFDLYDSFNDNNQNLISRNFVKMSKIVKDTTTYIFFDVSKKMVKEFVNIYIPSYFINQGIDIFYLKINFFNAINGKFRFFKCSETDRNASQNYLILQIDKITKTYNIINGDIISFQPNVYKISEVAEPQKEQELLDQNKIKKTKPIVKPNKIITSKGKFI